MEQNSVEILRGVFYSQECIAKKLIETLQKFRGNVSNMYVDSAYTYRILWRFCLTTTLLTQRHRFLLMFGSQSKDKASSTTNRKEQYSTAQSDRKKPTIRRPFLIGKRREVDKKLNWKLQKIIVDGWRQPRQKIVVFKKRR